MNLTESYRLNVGPSLTSSRKPLFLASQKDGLGNRLRAILNAIVYSEAYDGEYGFIWAGRSVEGAKFNAIASSDYVFDRSYASRYIKNPEDYVNVINLKDYRDGPFPEKNTLRACDAVIVGCGDVPEKFGHEPKVKFIPYRSAFERVRFSTDISCLRDKLKLETLTFSAVHVRGGDIVYGRHKATSEKFYKKATPWPYVLSYLDVALKSGRKPMLFCQDQISEDFFRPIRGVFFSSDYKKKLSLDFYQDAFADIFLMSECDEIIAPDSGFSTLAHLIGEIPKVSFQEMDLCRLESLSDEVLTCIVNFDKEQAAYCYLVRSIEKEKINDISGALHDSEECMRLDPSNALHLVRSLYLSRNLSLDQFNRVMKIPVINDFLKSKSLVKVLGRLSKHGFPKYRESLHEFSGDR